MMYLFSRHVSKDVNYIRARGQKDKFANSVDLDEVTHDEPPHLDLHCLASGLSILNMIWLG